MSPVLVEAMVRAVAADSHASITAITPIQDISEAQLQALYQGASIILLIKHRCLSFTCEFCERTAST